ncbi:uncharacterized protein LOC110251216 isoform X2 [Exaiptasia diaphana]|uniref:Uncharacterized protein n=1 Tax=Exaiptasia diaphana TaxID=2652724 RepID=A0A913YX34_EXADI|nr:uncharacterized protein LOC110251216 isoform X2 [Exaiptasia diaphana]KXJ07226.1 hypothetical protein AC249_AIPGENE14866 [Exaiptasia diaphana]
MESLENTSEAEKFLIRAGLHDYVGEFKKQKFEKMSDLKLFLSLDNNSWVVDKLNLPVCVLLQLQEALKHHSSEKTGDAEQCSSGINDKVQSNNCMDTDTNECKASNEASPKELKKSEILKLQKTNVEAQSANEELKTFTTYLAGKVKATKWHGGGALRLSSGTTHEEAQANNLLVNVILDDKAIKYGKCVVRGHGVVTLDRKRAKAFIGNKLSHTRKPSAYKGKDNKKSKTTCEGEKEQPTRRLPLEPEIAVPDVQEEQAKSRFQHEEIADIEEEQQIRKRPHLKEIADEEQPNKKKGRPRERCKRL